jgi:hypothetical protein
MISSPGEIEVLRSHQNILPYQLPSKAMLYTNMGRAILSK